MYGLRYEYNGPAYTLDDNIFSFDLATGKIVIPSDAARAYITPLLPSTIPFETADQFGTGRSLRNPDKNNFAPRFGFSYGLGNNGRTVIRGGWGIYYSHYSGDIPVTQSAGPFSATTVSTNSITNGQAAFTLASPFAIPGAPGHARAGRRRAALAEQLHAAVHRVAGTRVHAQPRRADQLYRIEGNAVAVSPRRRTSRSPRPWRSTTRGGRIPPMRISPTRITAPTCCTAGCRRR